MHMSTSFTSDGWTWNCEKYSNYTFLCAKKWWFEVEWERSVPSYRSYTFLDLCSTIYLVHLLWTTILEAITEGKCCCLQWFLQATTMFQGSGRVLVCCHSIFTLCQIIQMNCPVSKLCISKWDWTNCNVVYSEVESFPLLLDPNVSNTFAIGICNKWYDWLSYILY